MNPLAAAGSNRNTLVGREMHKKKVQHCTSQMAARIHLSHTLCVFSTSYFQIKKTLSECVAWGNISDALRIYFPAYCFVCKIKYRRTHTAERKISRDSLVETGPFKAKWVSVFILTTTHSAPFRPQQGSKGRWGEIELWVRWHVQKPHHQPPEVIQSPDPLCVCVKCRSQVSNPSSPSTGCSHWIIQERLNALCSEQTGTKPHLDRISHHKLWSKSALVQHENVITCLELWRNCSSW